MRPAWYWVKSRCSTSKAKRKSLSVQAVSACRAESARSSESSLRTIDESSNSQIDEFVQRGSSTSIDRGEHPGRGIVTKVVEFSFAMAKPREGNRGNGNAKLVGCHCSASSQGHFAAFRLCPSYSSSWIRA